MQINGLIKSQIAAGGVAGEPAARCLPMHHFGDPRAEYAAARSAAAVFDLSDRVEIEVSGNDRVKYLHNFCTNDVKRLAPGEGCEAFVTNVKGRILAHVHVFAAPDSLWVETDGATEESLLTHLGRYIITEDVELHSRSADRGELFVAGPQAAGKLESLGIDAATLPLYGHAVVPDHDSWRAVRRVDIIESPGFLVSIRRSRLRDAWQSLVDAGCRPAGRNALEVLRIEAGTPRYGLDITEDNLAQEAARTSRAISFTKGCYLGQEPIARLDALGHTNRELRGLRIDARALPERGATVTDEAGKEVGTITSSARLTESDAPVALAMLRSGFTAPGTTVRVVLAPSPASATVFWPS